MENLKNKKVLILGFSTTGIACAKYFANAGADTYISEFNEKKDNKTVSELETLGIKIEFNGDKKVSIIEIDGVKYPYKKGMFIDNAYLNSHRHININLY